ncbi:MAG TPA: hypothetical protein PLV68_08280, partial [Ilumatobacteraceae bacterium]|nr:hypothetical protein [Ilumatobacteraceae bacterium]
VADPSAPPLVLVTHHVDEVPAGMTHALLLREGRPLAAGPIDQVLTADNLSTCFGLPLSLERRPDGRLAAWSLASASLASAPLAAASATDGSLTAGSRPAP